MDLRPEDYRDHLHRILTTLVAPRPIGWISTLNPDGGDNLAPYSYFNAVCTDPPVVMFSAGRNEGERKHTTRNAIESGEFVANLVTEELVEAMDTSSASIASGESEFDFAGIERVDAKTVSAPRVAAAHACLECTVHDVFEIYDNTVVLGDVEHFYVDESLTTDGMVDTRKIDVVGRLGGSYYGSIELFDFERQY